MRLQYVFLSFKTDSRSRLLRSVILLVVESGKKLIPGHCGKNAWAHGVGADRRNLYNAKGGQNSVLDGNRVRVQSEIVLFSPQISSSVDAVSGTRRGQIDESCHCIFEGGIDILLRKGEGVADLLIPQEIDLGVDSVARPAPTLCEGPRIGRGERGITSTWEFEISESFDEQLSVVLAFSIEEEWNSWITFFKKVRYYRHGPNEIITSFKAGLPHEVVKLPLSGHHVEKKSNRERLNDLLKLDPLLMPKVLMCELVKWVTRQEYDPRYARSSRLSTHDIRELGSQDFIFVLVLGGLILGFQTLLRTSNRPDLMTISPVGERVSLQDADLKMACAARSKANSAPVAELDCASGWALGISRSKRDARASTSPNPNLLASRQTISAQTRPKTGATPSTNNQKQQTKITL